MPWEAIVTAIGGVFVAGIGAWAVVVSKRHPGDPGRNDSPLVERVVEDLMDQLEEARRSLQASDDRARRWEVEAARLKAELVEVRKRNRLDATLITRLRARVDLLEHEAHGR